MQRLIAAAHERLPEINKAATDMKGAPMTDVSLAELRWGYALVASRAGRVRGWGLGRVRRDLGSVLRQWRITTTFATSPR